MPSCVGVGVGYTSNEMTVKLEQVMLLCAEPSPLEGLNGLEVRNSC